MNGLINVNIGHYKIRNMEWLILWPQLDRLFVEYIADYLLLNNVNQNRITRCMLQIANWYYNRHLLHRWHYTDKLMRLISAWLTTMILESAFKVCYLHNVRKRMYLVAANPIIRLNSSFGYLYHLYGLLC